MKDHLNVLNSVSGANNKIDLPSFKSFKSPQGKESNPKTEEDLFDAQFKGTSLYDERFIEGMELEDALSYAQYIGDQSRSPEGRQLMSMAHNPISVSQVAQLFGMA